MISPSAMLRYGLALITSAFAFTVIAVATAMPAIAKDVGFHEWYAWMFTSVTMGQVLGTVVGGRLSDRRPAIHVMVAGMVLFTAATIGCAVSGTFPILLLCRLLQGVGSGLAFNGMFVLVARVMNEADRAKMMALNSAAWVLPGVVGPLISGWLTHHVSWRATFVIVVPLIVLGTLVAGPQLRAARAAKADVGESSTRAHIPAWVAVVVAGGVAGLQLMGQFRSWPWLVLGGAAVVAAIAVFPKLLPHRDAHPVLRWVIGARAGSAGGFFAAEAFVPLMLVTLTGIDLTQAGLILTVGALAWAAAAQWQARPWFPWGRATSIWVGSALVLLGVVMIVAWTQLHLSSWWVLLAWLPMAFGMGLSYMGVSLEVMRASTKQTQGRNAASLTTCESLGVALTTGVVGAVYSMTSTWSASTQFTASLSVAAVVTLLATLAAWRVRQLDATLASPPGEH